MNELVREIEEDIRRERIDKMWHGFGRTMVGVSIAIVLATVAVVVYQDHKRSEAMEVTGQMIKGANLSQAGDYKGALEIFSKLAHDESSPTYGLVMLRKAQAESALGQQDEAVKTYEKLAKHDVLTGQLAKLLSIGDSAGGDVIPTPERNTPLFYSQSEFRAWQLLKQGKKDQAVDQFVTLSQDMQVPHSMHERITEVLQHIAPEKLPPVAKANGLLSDMVAAPHE